MTDGERDRPDPGDPVEVEDLGESLDSVLEEEERSAIAATEAKFQSVRKDLEELKDRHLRKLAEFENVRKRAEREKAEAYRAALISFVKDFLPIADSFERALAHAPQEALRTDFGRGVALIDRQIAELWRKYGVTEVDTSGSFDPNLHEAVATQEVPGAPRDAIMEVLRKGYRVGDKLLRPASVRVAASAERKPGGGRRETGDEQDE